MNDNTFLQLFKFIFRRFRTSWNLQEIKGDTFVWRKVYSFSFNKGKAVFESSFEQMLKDCDLCHR